MTVLEITIVYYRPTFRLLFHYKLHCKSEVYAPFFKYQNMMVIRLYNRYICNGDYVWPSKIYTLIFCYYRHQWRNIKVMKLWFAFIMCQLLFYQKILIHASKNMRNFSAFNVSYGYAYRWYLIIDNVCLPFHHATRFLWTNNSSCASIYGLA